MVKLTKAKTFQAYLDSCHRRYSCVHCRAHLANHDELISKVSVPQLYVRGQLLWANLTVWQSTFWQRPKGPQSRLYPERYLIHSTIQNKQKEYLCFTRLFAECVMPRLFCHRWVKSAHVCWLSVCLSSSSLSRGVRAEPTSSTLCEYLFDIPPYYNTFNLTRGTGRSADLFITPV